MNRKGAKDAKFLPEPGACRKKSAGFGSGKAARFRDVFEYSFEESTLWHKLPRRALTFFLIVSPDQEEN